VPFSCYGIAATQDILNTHAQRGSSSTGLAFRAYRRAFVERTIGTVLSVFLCGAPNSEFAAPFSCYAIAATGHISEHSRAGLPCSPARIRRLDYWYGLPVFLSGAPHLEFAAPFSCRSRNQSG